MHSIHSSIIAIYIFLTQNFQSNILNNIISLKTFINSSKDSNPKPNNVAQNNFNDFADILIIL